MCPALQNRAECCKKPTYCRKTFAHSLILIAPPVLASHNAFTFSAQYLVSLSRTPPISRHRQWPARYVGGYAGYAMVGLVCVLAASTLFHLFNLRSNPCKRNSSR